MEYKGHSDEVSVETTGLLLDTGGKAIVVIKPLKTWLNCVCVPLFCGRLNLQEMTLDI